MKNLGLLVLMTALIFSCQRTKKQETTLRADSLSIDTSYTNFDAGKFIDDSDRPQEFDKFEAAFDYEDKEQSIRQRLGITWLTNDSIEFRLLSEDNICDTDYWGKASNNHPEMIAKSDGDEKGESDLTSEYTTEQDTYSLKIRLSLDKKSARILFVDKSGEDTDCMPTPDLVLVKKNVH